jgi:ribosomal protein S18 acetylase RimI-like enzyme
VKIRHAEPEDAEKIHDVALKSWKDTYSHILSEKTIEEVIEDWYSIEDLREHTEHPIFYVAENGEEVIGFVHATVENKKATLHRIYLDPEYQGQGIGSKLYEKTENDLKQDADKIGRELLAENKKGNNFYQKQGCKESETEDIE